MPADRIRIGFIGAGGICRSQHLPGLAAIDGVEVVAVCNRSRASSEKIAAEFNVPHVEEDWRQLVGRDDIDAVFIGTWPYRHKQMSIAVLEAGKHCFCQARMCMDLAESLEMHAAAEAHPQLVSMISPAPFPFELYVAHAVQSGVLGQITSMAFKCNMGANLDRTSVTFRERRELSGHHMLAVGICSEMLNSIFGPYETLAAQTSVVIDRKTDESGAEVEIQVPQVITITGRLANGALAVEHHTGLAVDATTNGETQLTVFGLDATLRTDLSTSLLIGKAGDPLEAVDVPADMLQHWTAEQDFIDAVRAARAGKPPAERPVRPDFAEGVLYMRKMEAVHESVTTGRAVKV